MQIENSASVTQHSNIFFLVCFFKEIVQISEAGKHPPIGMEAHMIDTQHMTNVT